MEATRERMLEAQAEYRRLESADPGGQATQAAWDRYVGLKVRVIQAETEPARPEVR